MHRRISVFMAGDNNLDFAALRDIEEEMRGRVLSPALSVRIELDRKRRLPWETDDAPYRGRRLAFDGADVRETILPHEVNTGDPLSVASFLDWAVDPSHLTLCIIWGHGGGYGLFCGDKASKVGLHPGAEVHWIAQDDTSGDVLSVPELARAVRDTVGRVDVLGFDACLMGTVEVAYELSDCTDVLVASQSIEPVDGWPYHRILAALDAPEISLSVEGIGRMIVDAYAMEYPAEKRFITLTAMTSSSVRRLHEPTDALAGELLKVDAGSLASLRATLHGLPRFKDRHYVDLLSLARRVRDEAPNSGVREAAATLAAAVRDVPLAQFSNQPARRTGGLSIYLPAYVPSTRVLDEYGALSFYQDNRWLTLLRRLADRPAQV